MGLTIHFDKEVSDALEQWLNAEARYIIGSFGKPYDLEKIFGAETNAIIGECKQLGDKVVSGISMVLDSDLKKLVAAQVRLQNGKTFLIDEKYRLLKNAEKEKAASELIAENGPRVFSVNTK